jgi:hypothetical protein
MKSMLFALFVAACGGDDGAGGGDADAGTDAPATGGSSAKQVYEAAAPMARTHAADAVLTHIKGTLVKGDTGEVDVDLQGSYWQLDFESAGTNQLINVLYSRGTINVTPGLQRAMLPPIMADGDWKDSTETVEKMKANGYTAPAGAPPEYQVAMDLAIFMGDPEDPRAAVREPFWHLEVIHDPPAGTPQTEADFQAAWVSEDQAWLICDLLEAACEQVP